MATLQELIETDLELTEKTAGQKTIDAEDASLEKLAASIGLDLDEGEEKAAEDDKKEEEKEEKKEEKDEEEGDKKPLPPFMAKESSDESMNGLFSTFFPDDELGETKTAEEEKVAAYQEHLGGLSFEKFAERWDKRIEKLAVDMTTGTVHVDSQPPQTLENNKAKDASTAIDTTPQITDEVKKEDDARTVGDYDHVEHSQKKTAAAMRKHALLAQLED